MAYTPFLSALALKSCRAYEMKDGVSFMELKLEQLTCTSRAMFGAGEYDRNIETFR